MNPEPDRVIVFDPEPDLQNIGTAEKMRQL